MRGMDKKFAGIPALAGASLEVLPAEVHALIGQNGAGKSTMIKILTGAYAKDAGEVSFDGRPFAVASPQEAQRHGISTIYQEINLVPYRSVTENIFLGREHRRFGLLDWGRMHREAAEVLRRFDVAVDVHRPLMSFNTAIQQMVAIARAVSFEAKLVIMDEPTSSLDEHEVAVLFDVIRQLKREGVAVIFVSHKLDELYAVCDRVTIMRDGRTVAVAPMADMTKLQLVAAMLGRDLATVRAEGATAFHGHAHAIGSELLRADHLQVGRRVRDVVGRGPCRRDRRPRRACWAPGAPRPRARCSRPTGRTAAASASAAARSISPTPAAAIAAGHGLLLARTARSRASSPTCRCART